MTFTGPKIFALSNRLRWPEWLTRPAAPADTLKRVAFEWIHATRFKFSFLCMSLSQNRCALLRDLH
ncbi:hypothetical protein BQ8482_120114 [Mesorhizobium delmotii]|uniref:Uncharacterized protein n=1 Tax=Mesorhizobium delmotii TaxID=1631247 RepID=A0A2P9AFZ5_9HYPH|nr:hypothetical protein BQ8482_120114 [Mesorhizobium delmotii]